MLLSDLQEKLATDHARVGGFRTVDGKPFEERFPKITLGKHHTALEAALNDPELAKDETLTLLRTQLSEAKSKLADVSKDGRGLQAHEGTSAAESFNRARTRLADVGQQIQHYLSGDAIMLEGNVSRKLPEGSPLIRAFNDFKSTAKDATDLLDSRFGMLRTNGLLATVKTHADQLLHVGDKEVRALHGKSIAVRSVGLAASIGMMAHAGFAPRDSSGETRSTKSRLCEFVAGGGVGLLSAVMGKAVTVAR